MVLFWVGFMLLLGAAGGVETGRATISQFLLYGIAGLIIMAIGVFCTHRSDY